MPFAHLTDFNRPGNMWHMISRSAVLEDSLSRSSLPHLFVLHGWSPLLTFGAQERNCRHGSSLFHRLVLGEASKCSLWYDCLVLWDVVRQNVDRCQLRISVNPSDNWLQLWLQYSYDVAMADACRTEPHLRRILAFGRRGRENDSSIQQRWFFHGQSLAQLWNARNEGLRWPEHGSISHDGSMVLVYMLTWLGYIDGIHVTIYMIPVPGPVAPPHPPPNGMVPHSLYPRPHVYTLFADSARNCVLFAAFGWCQALFVGYSQAFTGNDMATVIWHRKWQRCFEWHTFKADIIYMNDTVYPYVVTM